MGISRDVRTELEKRGVKVTAFEPIEPGQDGLLRRRQEARGRQARRDLRRRLLPGGRRDRQGDHPGSSPPCMLDYGTYDSGYWRRPATRRPTATWSACPRPAISPGSETYVSDYQDKFDEPPGTGAPTPTTR